MSEGSRPHDNESQQPAERRDWPDIDTHGKDIGGPPDAPSPSPAPSSGWHDTAELHGNEDGGQEP